MKVNELFFNKYDNIISLGCNCEVKHAILRRLWIDNFGNDVEFDLRSDRLPKSIVGRYYFDWSWSKNTIDSVITVLNHNFDLSFTNDNNMLTKSSVESELQLVNSKMYAIAQKTLSCLIYSSKILFVLYDNSLFHDVLKLIEKIENKFPALKFDLLWVFNDGVIEQHEVIYNNHIVFKYRINKVNYPGDIDGWFHAFDEVAKPI